MPQFTDEYDGLARDLEQEAGITPPASLRRDIDTASITRRIRRALPDILESFEATTGTRYIPFAIQDADGLKVHAGRGTRSFPVWFNAGPATFQIDRITVSSDQDNYSFILFRSASETDLSTASDVQIAAITVSSDGTSQFTASLSTFDSDTIPAGTWLVWEHAAGTADVLSVTVEGHFA